MFHLKGMLTFVILGLIVFIIRPYTCYLKFLEFGWGRGWVGRISNEVLPHASSSHPPIASRFFFSLFLTSQVTGVTTHGTETTQQPWTALDGFYTFLPFYFPGVFSYFIRSGCGTCTYVGHNLVLSRPVYLVFCSKPHVPFHST